MIFLMFFSIFPTLKADIDKKSNYQKSDMTSKIINLSQTEIQQWCDLVGITEEPIIDVDRYKAKLQDRLGEEILEMRTKNSKVFIKPDNTYTHQVYSGNVHFQDINGNWLEFDNKIIDFNGYSEDLDTNFNYACEQNTIRTYFRDGYTTKDSILMVTDNDYLSWEPISMAYLDFEGTEIQITKAINRAPVIKNDKILYPGTYSQTSDLFIVKDQMLKHEFILKSLPELLNVYNPESNKDPGLEYLSYSGIFEPSSDLTLTIAENTNKVNIATTTCRPLELINSEGETVFTLPSPIAYELNNKKEQINCKYIIKPMEDRFELSIATPYNWLTDQERSYPVVIDPTVAFKFAPYEIDSNDTFISMANQDSNYGLDEDLFIGGQYLNESTLIKFDISSLPDKSIPFQDAKLWLRTSSYPDFNPNPADISVYKMEQDWTEGTGTFENQETDDGATWNSPKGGSTTWIDGPGGTYANSNVDYTLITGTNENYDFDVSGLLSGLDGWRNMPDTNYGLLVRYENRTNHPNEFKSFYSSFASTASFRPRLEVTFLNTIPTVKLFNKYTWNEDEPEINTIIDLDDHFDDADHQPLNITLWTGSDWGQKFECNIFKATLMNFGNPNNPDYYCIIQLKEHQWGTQKITFNATDRISPVESEITIEVKSVNDPPRLLPIDNQVAVEDEYLYVPLEVIEVENQRVFWETNVSDYNNPDYMDNLWIDADPNDKFNDKKKQLVFLPDNSNVPEVYVSIIVRDEKHTDYQPSIDMENITIKVSNINDDPIFTKVGYTVVLDKEETNLNVVQGVKKSFYIQAFDEDIENDDDLTFYSDTDPEDNFTITPLSGLDIPEDFRALNTEVVRIDFIPTNDHVGEFLVNVGVKDLSDSNDEIKIRFNVENTNDPPVIESHKPKNNAQFENIDFINFSCKVDDPDLYLPENIYTEKLNITWYLNISSEITKLGYGTSVLNKKFKAGEYKIEIIVTDLEGAKARKDFTINVIKAITLQNLVDREYKDNSTYDDIEYSYNTNTRKFTITQGQYGDVDVVRLTSYYEDENLVIVLKFFANISEPIELSIRIYLVNPGHTEEDPDYDVEYSENFFDKVLYKPAEDEYFGYFTEDDGYLDERNNNEFIVKYSLADLEEGITDLFKPLTRDFEIFAIVKYKNVEYVDDEKIENFRYDSIGHISAFAPKPSAPSDDKKEGGIDMAVMGAGIGVIIVIIIIIIILFMIIQKRKKEDKKTVIDFSQQRPTGQAPAPGQIPQLFMSPFEQQFKTPPAMGPGPSSGMPAPSYPGSVSPSQPVQTTQYSSQPVPSPPPQPQLAPQTQIQQQPPTGPQVGQTPGMLPPHQQQRATQTTQTMQPQPSTTTQSRQPGPMQMQPQRQPPKPQPQPQPKPQPTPTQQGQTQQKPQQK
jgi:hypothetical protein